MPDRIRQLVDDLVYVSETDAPFEVIADGAVTEISIETVLDRFGDNSGKQDIEEVGFEGFFNRLTEKREWYGEREIKLSEKFSTLKQLLKENFTDLHVYRIGRVQIDIYIVGLSSDGILAGVKTKAVET